jgi:bifunctional DNA-binding transcriptional regulator/antitoxin component of YhaV-PrlF toxin-antitoxin module
MSKKYIVTVEQDTESNQWFFKLPDEIIEELGWQPGDKIKWIDNKNKSWSLIKDSEESNLEIETDFDNNIGC